VKYFIISQPKSGTYLLSNILIELGIIPTHLHISNERYEDYSNKGNDAVKNPKKYSKNIPIEESLTLIEDKSFAVGHLPYSENAEILLKDFKKILITRDINDIEKSWQRFNKDYQRKNGFNKELLNDIELWKKSNIFHITFEELITKDIKKLDSLQLFLFNKINVNSANALDNALNSPSLTKSSIR
jgi:hypothetical protein